ncbi:MAG: S8 family serine peptidase [Saprospiraceae bacterium]|nr:S8 family serine peptidase [Saprospiraceae bacterium]
MKAQTIVRNSVEVRVIHPDYLPAQNNRRLPDELRQLYSSFQVNGSTQKYPLAARVDDSLAEGLLRVYDLSCNGDAVELKTQLERFISVYFENVYLNYEPQTLDVLNFYPNDPLDEEWNFWPHQETNTPAAWEITRGDPRVEIAILDNGFDPSHEDLVHKIVYIHPQAYLSGSHGTNVAFMAAGDTDNGTGHSAVGFNCSLRLYPMGVNYILEAAVDGSSVINCSWMTSCTYNQNTHDIIKLATNKGAVVVAASGNATMGSDCGGTEENNPVYPAAFPEVICVTGSARWGCLTFNESCWETPYHPPRHFTHNKTVDVIAPGMCVHTAFADNRYDFAAGTSLASPFVAGAIGLMRAVDPCLTPAQIMTMITTTDQSLYGPLYCDGKNDSLDFLLPGVGLIDVLALVQSAKKTAREYHVFNGETLVWDNETIYARDIFVHRGGKLILRNGTILYMKKDNRIVVEQEAMLYVDSATITSACSMEQARWRGIFVHGNPDLAQPALSLKHPADILPYDFRPQESGVVALFRAHIENTQLGVSASNSEVDLDNGQPVKLGGLVLVEQSTFYNVLHGIEFLKYDKTNRSHIRNTKFIKSADLKAKVRGITIEQCRGLEFNGNSFVNMDYAGIGGIDFSAQIRNNNRFENCVLGIYIQSTYPQSSAVDVSENVFDANQTHLYASGTNLDFGLTVQRNTFYRARETSVHIEGPSTFWVGENVFSANAQSGVTVVNAGKRPGVIRQNQFSQGPEGITFYGNNSGSRFLSNCFNMDRTDVSVHPMDDIRGIINPFQGNTNLPAGNCFTTNAEHIRAEVATTFGFLYFVPRNESSPKDGCAGVVLPEKEENNFEIMEALVSEYPDCTWAKLQKNTLPAYALGNEGDIKNESPNPIHSNDSLYDLYGEKINHREWNDARILLDNMPVKNLDDQLFVQIQTINLERLTQPHWTLLETTRDFLHNTAMGTSPVRSYAGALYTLLTGEYAIPKQTLLFELSTNLSEAAGPPEDLSREYSIYPNPSSDMVWIALPKTDKRAGMIRITGITGVAALVAPLSEGEMTTVPLRLSGLPNGLYFVEIWRNQSRVYVGKLVLAKP